MGLSVEHWKDPKAHPAKLHHPAAFPLNLAAAFPPTSPERI